MSRFFPDDIILNIILRLSVKDLLRFRCVSKHWCKFIKGHDFVKLQLNHAIKSNKFKLMIKEYHQDQIYSIDYNDSSSSLSTCYEASEIDYPFKYPDCKFRILGSCNGLVCVKTRDDDDILLWNPSTKEYKILPKLQAPKHAFGILYGFGYDRNTEDYKFVAIDSGISDQVMVYSLLSNSWKSIKIIPSRLHCTSNLPGVFVNGALHWVMRDYKVNKTTVISFDIGHRTFKAVPLPEDFAERHIEYLGVMGGCLCLYGNVMEGGSFVLWVMKNYGVKESWTKLCSIKNSGKIRGFPSFRRLEPIQCFKNGEILLDKDGEALVLYDPNNERARILKIRGVPVQEIMTKTYLETLVSPSCKKKLLVEKKMKNKKKGKKNKKR